MINRSDPRPLYYQLAERIRGQIESGQIKAGDKLPSESEMVEAYGIGRLTIRGALSQLVNAGYLKKVHGKGTYCIASQLSPEQLNIDVILDMADTYFVPYYIKSTSAVLTAYNCNFIISDSQDNSDKIAEILEKIPLKGSSGIIIQPSHRCGNVPERIKEAFRGLRTAGIPYIMLDNFYEGIETSYTILDEYKGGCIAARYFHSLGHRHTAVIYMDEYKDSLLRSQGFSETYAGLGLPSPLHIPCNPNLEKTLAKKITAQKITALFCYNDETAVRCLHILKNQGISVPAGISILGFDDTVLASTVEPSLCSIAHPKQEMGKLAAQALLDLIHKKTLWPFIYVFEPRLIKRNSCARLKNS